MSRGGGMIGYWGIWRGGIALNEGAGPMNLTILFPWGYCGFFIYVYFFGKRWSWPKKLKVKE